MLRHFVKIVTMLMVCLVCMLAVGATPAEAGRTRMVLGFYYAWYDTSSFGPGITPFQPPHTYNSTSSATIRRQVKTAKAAGMDGFVQSWYGDNPNQQTEPNFQTLLNISQEQGFKATVHFESVSPFFSGNQDRIDSLKTLVYTHAKHPAFLRMDGKPVIFFWANWALPVSDWEYIRNQVDPGRTTIWMAEGGQQTEYLSVFDGMHLYNVAWSADPGGVNQRWANETRNYDSTKYWAGTAMPGFDNSLVPGMAHTVRARGNGDYLRKSFQGAAASDPDLMLVTSFNEWREGSNIEPSTAWGNTYINTLRSLSAEYKGTSAGNFPAIPAWQAAATPTPYPSWTPPPTWTPIPVTNTPFPTWTPIPPTNTPISTWTPIPATNTPWPTNTARPIRATKTAFPTNAPLPTAVSVSNPPPRNRSARPSATPVRQELAQTDGYLVYTVQDGDTLASIALRYGISEADLRDLNELTTDIIVAGQQLILGVVGNPQPTSVPPETTAEQPTSVPPTETTTTAVLPAPQPDGSILYAVEAEETVSQIATRFALPVEDVLRLNGLPSDVKVRPGNQLLLGYVGADGAIKFTEDVPSTNTPEPTDVPAATDTPANPNVTPTAQPDGKVIYIVQENESVYSIATRFGLNMNTVLRLNGLTELSIVQLGAPLLLGEVDPNQVVAAAPSSPDSPETENESPVNTSTRFAEATLREDGQYIHTVQVGDTATGIALQYGYTTMPDFYRASGLNPVSILTIGDQIIVGVQPVPQNVGGSTDTEDVLPTATAVAVPLPTETATVSPPPTALPPTIPAATPTAIQIELPQSTQAAVRVVGEPTAASPISNGSEGETEREIFVANEISGEAEGNSSSETTETTTPRQNSPVAAVAFGSFAAILLLGLVLLYWLLIKKG